MFTRGYSALPFLSRYKIGEVPALQLKQIAFLAFIILWITALTGLISLTIALALTMIGFLFEILRAASSAAAAAVKYHDAKYFAVIPIEIMLRVILYSGYVWAILMTIRKAANRLGFVRLQAWKT